ncbi:hypothetical protein DXD73_08615 [Streptococcus gallolyticus]|nr:hypothetical protein DXD73_08615 [Streptococcus gallolyticus]
MTTQTQYFKIINQSISDLFTIRKRALEIEHAYGIDIKALLVTDEYIEFYMTMATTLTTIQEIERWYSERFQDSSEYDAISNVWGNGPHNLNEALSMILDGLSDLTIDWLLYGGE